VSVSASPCKADDQYRRANVRFGPETDSHQLRLSDLRETGTSIPLSLMNMDDPAGRSVHAEDLKWLHARYPEAMFDVRWENDSDARL
jgi:hypothetical protein